MKSIVKIGKKGGALRIAKQLSEIRKSRLPKVVFKLVEDYFKENNKKFAKSDSDLGV